MDDIKRIFGRAQFNPLYILCLIAALTASIPTSHADTVTTPIELECPIPLMGQIPAKFDLSLDIPDLEPGSPLKSNIPVSVQATLEQPTALSFDLAGSKTTRGLLWLTFAAISNGQALRNGPYRVPILIEPFKLFDLGGSLDLNGAGLLSGIEFPYEDPYLSRNSTVLNTMVESLTLIAVELDFQTLSSNDSLVAPPLDSFTSVCDLIPGKVIVHNRQYKAANPSVFLFEAPYLVDAQRVRMPPTEVGSSTTQTVIITNDDYFAATSESEFFYEVDGVDDISVSTNCPEGLNDHYPEQGNCSLTISFSPQKPGPVSSIIRLDIAAGHTGLPTDPPFQYYNFVREIIVEAIGGSPSVNPKGNLSGPFSGTLTVEGINGSSTLTGRFDHSADQLQASLEPTQFTAGKSAWMPIQSQLVFQNPIDFNSLNDSSSEFSSSTNVSIPSISAVLFGMLKVPLGGGDSCQFAEAINATLTVLIDAQNEEVELSGSATLGSLQQCGWLTSILSSVVSSTRAEIEINLEGE